MTELAVVQIEESGVSCDRLYDTLARGRFPPYNRTRKALADSITSEVLHRRRRSKELADLGREIEEGF